MGSPPPVFEFDAMPTHNLAWVSIILRIEPGTYSLFHLMHPSGQSFVRFLVHRSGLTLQKIIYGQHVFFSHARKDMAVQVERYRNRREAQRISGQQVMVQQLEEAVEERD